MVLGRDKKQNVDHGSQTLISPSAEVHGDVVFSGGLHIQGKVIGNIRVQDDGGRLVIGESGEVEGEINVPRVIINGRVKGDVHAGEHLELAEKAVVEGNVYYTMIEMVMGARVNGKLVREEEGGRRNLPSPGSLDKKDQGGESASDTDKT
jgi:cytoskeletal protein CcmA (bactofilin family)